MAKIADLLSRLSYKPGWTFTIGEHEGKPAVVVLAMVPDVLGRKERFVLRGAKHITPQVERMTEEQLVGWIGRLKDAMEAHESDEWFRLDGVPVHDPHAPKETM